ncbi:MAG: tetratricopeptide repeat protein [Pirellulales bacterium]
MKSSLPWLVLLSLVLSGCATSSTSRSWRWPWQGAAASTPAPSSTASTPSPTPQPLSAAVPTEWPDEKKAASDLKLALAQMLDKQGSTDEAIGAYERMLRDDPKNAALARRLAVLLDKKGQPERAETYYLQALRLAPQDARLQADYGYHCYLQRRWGDAEKNLTQALERDANQPRAHGNLALVLARTQRVPQALHEFSLAGCSPPDAHANVAFALASESQFAQAEEQYRTALSLDPGHQRSQTALTALVQARQQAVHAPPPPAPPGGAPVPAGFQPLPAVQPASHQADGLPRGYPTAAGPVAP